MPKRKQPKTTKQPAKDKPSPPDIKKPLPPGTERRIVKNNAYYSELERIIWRSING